MRSILIPIAACICSLVPSQLRASEEVPPFLDAATTVQEDHHEGQTSRGVWGIEVEGGFPSYHLVGEMPAQYRDFSNCRCLDITVPSPQGGRAAIRITRRVSEFFSVAAAAVYTPFSLEASSATAPQYFLDTAEQTLHVYGELITGKVAFDELALEPSARFELPWLPVFIESGGSVARIFQQRGSTQIAGLPAGFKSPNGDTLSYWETTRIGTPRTQASVFVGIGGVLDVSGSCAFVATVRMWGGLTPFFQESSAKIDWVFEPRVGLRFEL